MQRYIAYISRSQPWGAQEILENQKLAQNWHKVRHHESQEANWLKDLEVVL